MINARSILLISHPQMPASALGRSVQRVLLVLVNPIVLVALYSYLYIQLHLPDYKVNSIIFKLSSYYRYIGTILETYFCRYLK